MQPDPRELVARLDALLAEKCIGTEFLLDELRVAYPRLRAALLRAERLEQNEKDDAPTWEALQRDRVNLARFEKLADRLASALEPFVERGSIDGCVARPGLPRQRDLDRAVVALREHRAALTAPQGEERGA